LASSNEIVYETVLEDSAAPRGSLMAPRMAVGAEQVPDQT